MNIAFEMLKYAEQAGYTFRYDEYAEDYEFPNKAETAKEMMVHVNAVDLFRGLIVSPEGNEEWFMVVNDGKEYEFENLSDFTAGGFIDNWFEKVVV